VIEIEQGVFLQHDLGEFFVEGLSLDLVGHEPDMGMLLNKLLWAGLECEFPFKKAGVARVDVGDMPPTGPGTLKWYMPPKIAHSLLS